MKTWEMIKELTENPSKKFMCKSEPRKGRTVGMNGGSIDWHDEYRTSEFDNSYLSIRDTLNWKWEEVKEPVDFMIALESGKPVRVESATLKKVINRHSDFEKDANSHLYKELEKHNEGYYQYPNFLLASIAYYSNKHEFADIVLNGEWYIED